MEMGFGREEIDQKGSNEVLTTIDMMVIGHLI
jgi:hypothetical protein